MPFIGALQCTLQQQAHFSNFNLCKCPPFFLRFILIFRIDSSVWQACTRFVSANVFECWCHYFHVWHLMRNRMRRIVWYWRSTVSARHTQLYTCSVFRWNLWQFSKKELLWFAPNVMAEKEPVNCHNYDMTFNEKNFHSFNRICCREKMLRPMRAWRL